MTITRGFAITIASGLAFAVAGLLLGGAIGLFAPDYYRIVFRLPPDVNLNPVQAGIGLGLTQGLAAGLVVGLVIVLVVAWHNSRQSNRSA